MFTGDSENPMTNLKDVRENLPDIYEDPNENPDIYEDPEFSKILQKWEEENNAYRSGNDVIFLPPFDYEPYGSAHELPHVIQQRSQQGK